MKLSKGRVFEGFLYSQIDIFFSIFFLISSFSVIKFVNQIIRSGYVMSITEQSKSASRPYCRPKNVEKPLKK